MKNERQNFKAEVELSKRFISEFTIPTPSIQIKQGNYRTSYSYKHNVESYFCTYISNEAFIRAAKELNIHCKPTESGNNKYFAFKLNDKKYKFEIENNEWEGKFATAFERVQEINNLK